MKMWSKAAELAARTPESRNRYVDFLRAISILAVILGHWTAAAPYVDARGKLAFTHVLALADWTHWLTWVIQVMPIFFMVGGFSNGITWRAARRDGTRYRDWLAGRLKRLVWPVLPLLVAWVVIGAALYLGGARPELVRVGSQMALIPTWFLAVYLGVVVLVPLSHALWVRLGFLSFWGFCAAAVVVDWAFFRGQHALGWANYLFVWSAVHQLGYAWSDEQLADWRRTVPMFLVGLVTLILLTTIGPYPRAMVGVPGDAFSNTTPPKITLIALAAAQGGLLLTLQVPLRRWLVRARPWTATVLVNGMIMTIYLWHLTAMALWIGLAFRLGGIGLHHEPGSAAWWRHRPLWLLALVLTLLPLVLVFARFERPKTSASAPSALRLVAGAALLVFGLALLAKYGIAGDGWLGLRLWVLALPFLGAALIGMGPRGSARTATKAAADA
jgi:hypothetical protein